MNRTLTVVVVALGVSGMLGGCTSGPSTSFSDGWHWANSDSTIFGPGGYRDYAQECSDLAVHNMPAGDDVGQWEAGCVSSAKGHGLP